MRPGEGLPLTEVFFAAFFNQATWVSNGGLETAKEQFFS